MIFRLVLYAGLCLVAHAAGPVELKVAAVQFRSTFDLADNTRRIIASLERLASQGVRVAAYPECALTGYQTGPNMELSQAEIEKAESEVAKACARFRIAAVVGSVYKSGNRAYDTAIVINSRGELIERYGKLMLAGEKWAVPGNHIALFELEGVLSTVIICHDERYPEFVRLPAMAGARLVYYVSHESGMKQEHKLPGYRAQMMARAVENGVWVVASNAPANPEDNTGSHGQSRIIKDDGNILQEAGFFSEETVIETIQITPGKLTRPLEGVTGAWWKQGLEQLLANRNKKLD